MIFLKSNRAGETEQRGRSSPILPLSDIALAVPETGPSTSRSDASRDSSCAEGGVHRWEAHIAIIDLNGRVAGLAAT
jgi:hypothetical protein